MLKVAIIFSFIFIAFCNGDGVLGAFDQIVLTQSNPRANSYKIFSQWEGEQFMPENPGISMEDGSPLKISNPWNIVSLWPLEKSGNHPTNCNYQNASGSDQSIDDNLKRRLLRQWPPLNSDENPENTWINAWTAHGTCMSNFEELKTPKRYLKKALELLNVYNIGTVLSKREVETGNEYSAAEIRREIDDVLSIDPVLDCYVDEAFPEQYLAGASICIDEAFRVQQCLVKPPSTCDYRKRIIIP